MNELHRCHPRIKTLLVLLCCFTPGLGGLAAAESAPAVMISEFRMKQGEGRVAIDATLNRIALDQATAMAAKDKLDHDVLGPFNSRMAPAKAGRAAENIAYGYDKFEKTLDQWINSSGHRKNLLLHNAERVGVASATSAASHRTYWAMVIAGDYEPPPSKAGKKNATEAKKSSPARSCSRKILGICF